MGRDVARPVVGLTAKPVVIAASLLLGGCASTKAGPGPADERYVVASSARFHRLESLVEHMGRPGVGNPACGEIRTLAEEQCKLPEPECAAEADLCPGARKLCDVGFRATFTFCTTGNVGFPECDSNGCEKPAVIGRLPAVAPSTSNLYARACDAGDASACAFVGLLARVGNAGPIDASLARKMYDRACDGGVVEGCYESGLASYWGLGVAADIPRGVGMFRRACAMDAKTCYALGAAALDGRGVARDHGEAMRLFGQACDAGKSFACRLRDCAGVVPPDAARQVVFMCASDEAER